MTEQANAEAAATIRLDGVSKQYGEAVAVKHLDLAVRAGEIAILVGPSGCGKTTTMRMINRLIEPTSGRIFLDGEDVTKVDAVHLRRRIGYVIQQVGLFPHQTIATNVATVPRLLGWERKRINSRTDELLDLVGLDPGKFAKRYPHELSGGQRQRVGVARALAADPPVLLMDEPFGAVDPIARDRLQGEFLRLQETVRKTVVFVTHDVDEAVRLGDRIAVMRDGGLEQYDEPTKILTHPASGFVADFFGADRSLRRLRVSGIDPKLLKQWPVVSPDAALSTVGTIVDGRGVIVAAGPEVTGVITASPKPNGGDGTAASAAQRVAVVRLGEPLESALAAMLAAGGTGQPAAGSTPANGGPRDSLAVVLDGQGVAGILTLQGLIDSAWEGREAGSTS